MRNVWYLYRDVCKGNGKRDVRVGRIDVMKEWKKKDLEEEVKDFVSTGSVIWECSSFC